MIKPESLVLGLLLSLPACTDPETQPQPLQDAGADAPIDAPSDAPPDPPAVCAALCAAGERCIEGACQAVDVLNLNLGEDIIYESGAEYDTKARARACGTLASAPWSPVLPAPLGAEGPCKVWNYASGSLPPPPPAQPVAPGGVTITTPTGTFLLPSMGADCSTGTPTLDLFAQSGAIAVDGDGSGHFPLFHVEVTPPLPLDLTSTPLVRGQPLTLTWQASSTTGIAINIYTLPQQSSAGTAPWIRCDAPDTGSLTISAALTSLLDPGGTYANILGSRSVSVVQEPASSPIIIYASMARSNQLLVDYTP
jgi:hypothetical protein